MRQGAPPTGPRLPHAPELSRAAPMSRNAALLGFGLDLARALGIAIGIVVASFFLIRVVPGDVVDVLGIQGDMTYQQQSKLREELGLTYSWLEQFRIWLGMMAQGDFGVSSRFTVPVMDLIRTALPPTIKLGLMGMAIGLVLGLSLPVLAILYPRSPFPFLVNFITIWSITMPTFAIGIAAVIVFAVWLGWIPAIGNFLVPAIILGLDIAGTLAKMFHEDLKALQTAEFVRTARAKGLSDVRIVLSHIVPNALAVALALMGLIFAGVLSGTITLEVVFGLPGIGSLTLGAMKGRDYPTVQAVVIWLGLVVVAANLLTDTVRRLIDPRLRRS